MHYIYSICLIFLPLTSFYRKKIIHMHYNINTINIFRAKENTPEAVYKKRNRERVMQISNMAHMSEPLL
ncbi:hypothetical protein DK094_16115 [Salmonella enterica subsp. enterica]|uniref:Uncharacterized protein n=1 Tax=Salmonella enterica subsp. enterica serovar Poona TaxID=436295 RepID=A0A4Z0K6J6_SALET|nr:hypothetical protein [Salmonella enterica subsp. enterica serovar Telelkebir]TGD15312.1 hypothetical protein C9F10_27595 [Salmonella enterica subsp. enterica serovar Poona]TGD30827.1 hypothetical protein C9F07_35820 [Salmonella enterica subsp. enterica serovar Poona]